MGEGEGRKRLRTSCVLKAGQRLGEFVQLRAEGWEGELLSDPLRSMSSESRPPGGAAHPPITGQPPAPAGSSGSSSSGRPPCTQDFQEGGVGCIQYRLLRLFLPVFFSFSFRAPAVVNVIQ